MVQRGLLKVLDKGRVTFRCPACKEPHAVNVAAGGWDWNGSYDAPTFRPPLLTHGRDDNGTVRTCHMFVTDGQVQFLEDSTHALAGQTVPIEKPEGS